jgi:autotransporter-associated beta strand protein
VLLTSLTFGADGPATITSTTPVPPNSPGFIDLEGYNANFDGSGAYSATIAVPLTDGSLNKTGPATLILAASNTYANTTISAGTLQIGNNGTAGSLGTGSVTDNATLQFARTDSISVSNAISGTGNVSITSGTVSLTGSNSYTGGTVIAGGTLTQPNLGFQSGNSITFNNGTFLYQPSSPFDLSLDTLTFQAGGATINTNGNNVTFNNSVGNGGAGGLTKAGNGTLTLNGQNYLGPTTVTGGALKIGSLAAKQPVSIGAGSAIILNPNSGPQTISSLSIAAGGDLDIANNDLFIDYGSGPDPIASIIALIVSGYAGGTWNGSGIISSTAQDTSASYGIGYADSADAGNPAGLSSGQIEIKYTLLGDANLDGKVNGIDFAILAANFNQSVPGWDKGDFNYDFRANGIDFTELAANFNQGISADSTPGDTVAALDAFAAANGLMADVPEPTTAALLMTGAAALLTRRRRKC